MVPSGRIGQFSLEVCEESEGRVRNHDPPQWYDIVLFEHKLSWLCFWFPQKASYQWRFILFTYKPMIIFLISRGGTPHQQSSPQTKYTIEPPLRPMEPSNNLPLIEARLLSLEPLNKVHLCSTLESLFDYAFETHNFFVRHLRILLI